MYSDLYLKRDKNKFLIITAVVVMVIFVSFLNFSNPPSVPLSATSKSLKLHEVVNLSPHQAGIFWQSDKKETGWVLYGETKEYLPNVAKDERDVGDKKEAFVMHFAMLKGLQEGKTYYYKLVSDKEVIVQNSKEPFSFTTTQNVPISTNIKPAYGKVILANGQPAQNAFVMYNYPNAHPLLTLTKLTGEWLIPLQQIIEKKTNQLLQVNEKEKIRIEVSSENGTVSKIEALVQKTNPLPQTVVLGRNYKFLEETDVLPASTSVENAKTDFPISILLPKENSLIPGQRPLLKGQAIPGKQVKIQINSQPGYISRIESNTQGEWRVNVPVAIPAGSYTLTVTTEDAEGKSIEITRKFAIAKSGEQVLGAAATPSASVSATATPTSSPSATPTLIASPSPTLTLPLFTNTPISTASITALPSLGALDVNPVVFGSLGLIIFGLGMMFVF